MHRRHHRALQRISLDRLPSRCLAFAAEYDLEYVLTRYYARSV